jgi:4-amino-4-deoxy-L-arabinose transferase-like glycosyltransferase
LDKTATAASVRRHLWLPSLIWLTALLASPFYTHLVKPDSPREMMYPLALSVGIGAALFLLCAAVAWQQLKKERLTQGVLAIALGGLLSISIGTLGHDAYGKLKSSRDLVKVIAPYITPDTEVFSVRTYEQSFPYYLNRNVVLVDFVDEFDFGQKQEPQKWMPKIDQFIARWNEIPHAAAMMGQDTYDSLQAQGLAMQVVYRDPRRLVVIKPAVKQ